MFGIFTRATTVTHSLSTIYFPSSSAITSPNLGGSPEGVTQTFIPKESEPLVILLLLGDCTHTFMVAIGCASTRKCLRLITWLLHIFINSSSLSMQSIIPANIVTLLTCWSLGTGVQSLMAAVTWILMGPFLCPLATMSLLWGPGPLTLQRQDFQGQEAKNLLVDNWE